MRISFKKGQNPTTTGIATNRDFDKRYRAAIMKARIDRQPLSHLDKPE